MFIMIHRAISLKDIMVWCFVYTRCWHFTFDICCRRRAGHDAFGEESTMKRRNRRRSLFSAIGEDSLNNSLAHPVIDLLRKAELRQELLPVKVPARVLHKELVELVAKKRYESQVQKLPWMWVMLWKVRAGSVARRVVVVRCSSARPPRRARPFASVPYISMVISCKSIWWRWW